MADLTIPLEIAAALVVLFVLLLVAITVRRYQLARRPGSFDLSIREVGGSWSIGVARYGSAQLDWYRVFSLSPRPSRVYERRRLSLGQRRVAAGTEVHSVLPSDTIVRCQYVGQELDFALTDQAYFGLSSWTESAPPGQVRLY